MSLTARTITHTFSNSDLTPASGSVTFALSKRITNGTQSLVPSEITSPLNASGQLSQSLTANTDVGTTPGDSEWIVTLRILGASQETFAIVVPPGPGTTDLGALLPQQPLGG